MIAGFFSKAGTVLTRLKLFSLSISCYKIAMTIDPGLDRHFQIANALVSQGRYKEAAALYKRVIGLQPTLSTVYNLGWNLAKKGDINDEFYQSILNVIETPEIVLMLKVLAKSPAIYQPSKLWLYYMLFNTFQIETGGIENFKRTVNHNYFNWTGETINTQFLALKNKLNWSESDLVNAEKNTDFDPASKPREFTEEQWKKYIQYLCMLFEFTVSNDHLKILDHFEEPALGNPVTIRYKGRKISQDICNSVLEVNTMMQYVKHDPGKKLRVMELGAGSGRVGSVLLHAASNIQLIIVDIAPALYVSQWYLTHLFPERRAFRFRDFSDYKKIQQEFEESSIAFLSPVQVNYLPDKSVDLFINISSLHEMTSAQIDMWFGQVDRVCKGWFYTKQYHESVNSFDDIRILKTDYPKRPHWQELLNRTNPVYPDFFETIYKLN